MDGAMFFCSIHQDPRIDILLSLTLDSRNKLVAGFYRSETLLRSGRQLDLLGRGCRSEVGGLEKLSQGKRGEAVRWTALPHVDCLGHTVYRYEVDLSQCVLLCQETDPRAAANPPEPAQPGVFRETRGFGYWLDIVAIVGIRWLPTGEAEATGHVPSDQTEGGHFWGWQTSPALVRLLGEINLVGDQRGFGRIGADFWPVLDGPPRTSLIGRYPDSSWLNLDRMTRYVLLPGPDGPVSSARFEMIREGIQEFHGIFKAIIGCAAYFR